MSNVMLCDAVVNLPCKQFEDMGPNMHSILCMFNPRMLLVLLMGA